jgi:hypothetical protein
MNLNNIESNSSTQKDPYQNLKRAVWIYFFLLLFEGALRKWFLPSLNTPLMLVRDPVGIWLLYKAIQYNIFPINMYVIPMIVVSIISFNTTLMFGHQNIFVALYGLRILLIYFPLMFVIGKIFNKQDVIKVGIAMMWISIPMIVLLALQFYSPQSAWVNRGVGGDIAGGGFNGGAMGFFRPPGTFSFTSGNVYFWSLLVPYIFYFWLVPQKINRFLLIGASIALLVSIPLSISRTLLFQVLTTFLFAAVIMIRKPKYLGRMVIAICGMFFLFFVVKQFSGFQTGTEAFTHRFTTANKAEGGIEGVVFDRFLGGLTGPIIHSNGIPFFGHGLGMGTNVGSQLLTGKLSYLIAEGEWGRLIGEMGIILGLSAIFIRSAFVFTTMLTAFKRLKYGNMLPWFLLSYGMLTILLTQWAQPTSLGFSSLIGGLILASLKKEDDSILKNNL